MTLWVLQLLPRLNHRSDRPRARLADLVHQRQPRGQIIAADATPPAFGWDHAYTLPAGCVRLLPLTHDGSDDGSPIAHAVEGGKVLTNMAGPLKVRFVNRATNYDAYHPLFIDYISARLARCMAHWLTASRAFSRSPTR
jgi:hypothetical protein